MSDLLEVVLQQHLEAIRLCLANHLRNPALMLIYGGIDVMANLSQVKKQSDRHDFVLWCERDMDCQTRIGVSGLDLYAARCGVLHTYTADSSLSRQRGVCRIFYTWGNMTPDEPNMVLRALGRSEKMVKIEDLFSVLEDGIKAFRARLAHNPSLAAAVHDKAQRFFSDQAKFPGVEI